MIKENIRGVPVQVAMLRDGALINLDGVVAVVMDEPIERGSGFVTLKLMMDPGTEQPSIVRDLPGTYTVRLLN